MTRRRLLVVDDQHDVVDLIRRVADAEGFDARGIHDGAAFMSIHDAFDPDAIVLDIVMPEIDGIELLNFLANRGSTARILILSGMGDSILELAERYGEAQGLNIVGSLGKPLRLADLRRALVELGRAFRAEDRPAAIEAPALQKMGRSQR